MITLIHGDDTAASRKHFTELKQNNPDAASVEGQTITLTDLTQILEGGGLFTEEKTVFIEQLIAKKKNTSEFKPILAYISNPSLAAKIVLWENKELEKASLSQLKGAQVKLYKLPQSLFLFLDSFKPNSGQQLITLFHQTIETVEVEAVFAMLVRQIRILLALHPDANKSRHPELISGSTESQAEMLNQVQHDNSQIDEVKRLQDWQRSKLKTQAQQFTLNQLLTIFCQLFVMEKKNKTGTLPHTLVSSIDILLLEV